MKGVLCALAVLCLAGVVNAATGSSAVLAPSAALESFLESGSHTADEIDAMAQAEVAAVLSASSASDSESDLEAAAEAAVEAESEMPRDTKQQKRDLRRRKAAKMAEAAAKKANPPPKPFNPVAAAANAIPAGSDRDDIIKLVYDELKRLGGAGAVVPGSASTPQPSPLGVSDPRIQTLESRLNMFEKRRTEAANQAQDSAIASITARLEGLDKTLSSLKKSAESQAALSAQIVRASQQKEAAGSPSPLVDYSVSYEKATLPADFDKKVEEIFHYTKTEARKIYERYCKRFAKAAAKKAVAKAAAKNAREATKSGLKEKLTAKRLAAQAIASEKAVGDGEVAADAGAPGPVAGHAGAAAGSDAGAPVKHKKLLFSPVVAGKEPTPEGMRLSKALNDVATALPVIPAYQLGRAEQALHDVLGESAVSNKFKTARL